MDWGNFTSTLIGALIGGGASVWGGLIAARTSINAQKLVMQDQINDRIQLEKKALKMSAHLVWTELFIAISGAIRVGSGKESSVGMAIGSTYPEQIHRLMTVLSADEIFGLYKLYGHIEKLKKDFSNYDHQSAFNSLRSNSAVFLQELFGERYNAILTQDPDVLNKDNVIVTMNHDYELLFRSLEGLK